jgi:hypothetical protein
MVGAGEKLSHEVSCLRFVSENSEELSERMKFFIHNPGLIADYGREARKVYEAHFTIDGFESSFLDIIEPFTPAGPASTSSHPEWRDELQDDEGEIRTEESAGKKS